jgi:hypothetical protein
MSPCPTKKHQEIIGLEKHKVFELTLPALKRVEQVALPSSSPLVLADLLVGR